MQWSVWAWGCVSRCCWFFLYAKHLLKLVDWAVSSSIVKNAIPNSGGDGLDAEKSMSVPWMHGTGLALQRFIPPLCAVSVSFRAKLRAVLMGLGSVSRQNLVLGNSNVHRSPDHPNAALARSTFYSSARSHALSSYWLSLFDRFSLGGRKQNTIMADHTPNVRQWDFLIDT